LAQFARVLAAPRRSVALLKLEAGAVHLRIFYHKDLADAFSKIILANDDSDEYTEDHIPAGTQMRELEASGSGQIREALEKIISQVDYLLIGWGPEYDSAREPLFHRADALCVLVHPQNDHLITSYQLIKSVASQSVNVPIGVFISQAEDQAQAHDIFTRLNQTAGEFAETELLNFGYNLADQPVAQELLWRADLEGRGEGRRESCIAQLEEYLRTIVPDRPITNNEPALENSQIGETQQPPGVRSGPNRINNDAARSSDQRLNGQGGLISFKLYDPDTDDAEAQPDSLVCRIGLELLPDAVRCDDALTEFLRNCTLQCCKVRQGDVSVMIVLVRDDADRQTALWALTNYSQPHERLMVISAVPIEPSFQRVWSKKFADVKIIQALEGHLDGKPTLIVRNI